MYMSASAGKCIYIYIYTRIHVFTHRVYGSIHVFEGFFLNVFTCIGMYVCIFPNIYASIRVPVLCIEQHCYEGICTCTYI